MREIILIRTHFYCEATDRLYWQLKNTSQRDVAFICDETNGPVDIGTGKVKISISEDAASALGLHIPKKFGWLCGDYCFYLAVNLLRGYDRYWLFESDVRFDDDNTSRFFDEFASDPADFLAFHIFKAGPNWYWYNPMHYFQSDVHACLFPVVGVSRRAAEFAYLKRKEMSKTFDDIVPKADPRRWPNDESFLMSTLTSNGFSCRSLDKTEVKFRTNDSFNVGLPKSEARISGQQPTGLFYHPVHSKSRFVAKANEWLNTYIHSNANKANTAKAFDETFMNDLKIEASPEEYQVFEERLLQRLMNAPE